MLLNCLLLLLAVIGHPGICVIVYNRVHATGWARWIRKGSEKIIAPFSVLFPIAILVLLFRGSHSFEESFSFYRNHWLAFGYALICWPIAAYVIALFVHRKLQQARVSCVLSHRIERFDISDECEQSLAVGQKMKLLERVPGNGIFQLAVETREISVPNLPGSLDGFSITQLSDFHFTGGTHFDFFANAIEKSNALQSDIVLVTGDIIDKAECLDWIDLLLSRVTAPLGVYYVLGNHDRRVQPVWETRRRLDDAGWIPVSGRWETIQHADSFIHLCGNDMPWFNDAKNLPAHPAEHADEGVRILLSHTPDQVYWAGKFGIDLMLAGHTHGGQIRLPFFGSIVSASRYGNAFSAGTYEEGGLIMHVNRGLSGTQSLRWNSPPEITRLVLRCK